MSCTWRYDDLLNFFYLEKRGCRTRDCCCGTARVADCKMNVGCNVGRTELNVVKRTAGDKRMLIEADYDKTCRIQRQYSSIKQCSLSQESKDNTAVLSSAVCRKNPKTIQQY
jgi:hypothetical protein